MIIRFEKLTSSASDILSFKAALKLLISSSAIISYMEIFLSTRVFGTCPSSQVIPSDKEFYRSGAFSCLVRLQEEHMFLLQQFFFISTHEYVLL